MTARATITRSPAAIDGSFDSSTSPATSAPEMRGSGSRTTPRRFQMSRWFKAQAPDTDQCLSGARLGIGRIFVAELIGVAVCVKSDRLHDGLRTSGSPRFSAVSGDAMRS